MAEIERRCSKCNGELIQGCMPNWRSSSAGARHSIRLLSSCLLAFVLTSCDPCSSADECTLRAKEARESTTGMDAAKRGCELGSQEACVLMTIWAAASPTGVKQACQKGDELSCALLKGAFRESPDQQKAIDACMAGRFGESYQLCEAIPQAVSTEKASNRRYRSECFDYLTLCLVKNGQVDLGDKAVSNIPELSIRAERALAVDLKKIQLGNADNGRASIGATLDELGRAQNEIDTLVMLGVRLATAGERALADKAYEQAFANIEAAKDPSIQYLNLISGALRERKFDEAELLVVRFTDKSAQVHAKARLAKAIFDSGDRPRAEKLFRQAADEAKMLPEEKRSGVIDLLSHNLWDLGLRDIAKQVIELDAANAAKRLKNLESRK